MVYRTFACVLLVGALCAGLVSGATHAETLMRWGLARMRVHLRLAWRFAASLAAPHRPDLAGQPAIWLRPPRQLPGVVFTNGHIDPFTLDALRGQGVLILFGSAHCHNSCLRALALLAHVKAELGPYAQQVRVVVINIDQDGAPLLRLVRSYDPDFMVLTAKPADVLPFARRYGMTIIQPRGAAGHPTLPLVPYLVYLDRQGRWVACFPLGMSAEEIADEIIYAL
jgi:cytochrome oxidase Cu insertion factor (SCO1/SenC/PrrC family)